MLIAVSLMFRYADFVKSLGGNEANLGMIVGLGTLGAILFRFVQGPAIDHYGPVAVWIVSLAGLAISLVLHLTIQQIDGWPVILVRGLMNLCVAGVFGAWLSFVSLRVPADRVAEVIGVVGTSGFLGMGLGPVIGDWIFDQPWQVPVQVRTMFLTAAGIVTASMVFPAIAGWLESRAHGGYRRLTADSRQRHRTGMAAMIRKYHPGFLLVVAAVMGMTISLPGTFLPLFVEELGFVQLKIFFVTYNAVAFVSRLLFRMAPSRLGLRNTILAGLGFMGTSMLLYNVVDSPGDLVWPAIAGGLAHSFLFPAVVAGGTAFFPRENRGLATSLMLAMYDFGVLLGMPLAGWSVIVARQAGWSGYSFLFGMVSVLLAFTAVALCFLYRRGDGSELSRRTGTAASPSGNPS